MKIYKNIIEVPFSSKRALTIGSFDGVHLGHISILQKLLTENQKHLKTMVLTFEPLPRSFFNKNANFKLLTTNDEKLSIFEKKGIDETFVIPFNEEFANLSAIDFINNYLYKKIGFNKLYIGFNNYFGKNRTGSYELLKSLHLPDIEVIPCNPIVNNNTVISSSKIRKLIANGNIEDANTMLGRTYSIKGTIIKGKQIGRKIGFPTINIQIDKNKLLPKNAVYACEIELKPQILNIETETQIRLKGMANIGIRPTFYNTKNINLEVNIFDFYNEVYHYTAEVFFKKYIREERKFENVESLVKQINKDKILCIEYFNASN